MKPLFIILLACLPMYSFAWDDADERRWQSLNQELRCLVCQNQSIADSHADLAQDLRAQVRKMIEEGQTDAQIRTYMTDRYGDFVLYRPPFKSTTYLLWFGPLILLSVGLLFVWRLRRAKDGGPASQAQQLSKEQLDAVLKEAERD